MSKTKVLLVGAAGETGGSIANGLLEDGSFVGAPVANYQRSPSLAVDPLSNCHS